MRACVMGRCLSDSLAAFSSKGYPANFPRALPFMVVQRVWVTR
jgi:hypothetical protein